MNKTRFWNAYKIIAGIALLLGIIVLSYVEKSLITYEKAQPEKVVEAEMKVLAKAAKEGTLNRSVDMSHLSEQDRKDYVTGLSQAKNWRYEILSGSYSETGQVYGIYADDKIAAKVELSCDSSKILMVILTVNDWKIENVSAVYEKPVDITAEPTGVATLTEIPTPTPTTGEIVIEKYRYTFYLPEEYSVRLGDTVLTGESTDGVTKYVADLSDTEPVFAVTDPYGSEVEYAFGSTLVYYDIKVNIPSNFAISYGDADLEQYVTAETDIPDYEYCLEYADMPKLKSYEFPKSLTHPEFVIIDNTGATLDYTYDGDVIDIRKQSAFNEVPTEVADTAELLRSVEMWSLFLTGDVYKYDLLTGTFNGNAGEPSDRGLSIIKRVLVPDSYLESVAVKYSKSVDITFISRHTLPKEAFTKESVRNFVMYSDDFFSCEIGFEKTMLKTDGSEFLINGERDKMNCVCYFVRNKDYTGESGTYMWRLAELRDIIESEDN